ncbi:MAG TPA: hypothetical protein [Caudoviricetes sp.]|nr:MAG TPA: hypothetical protein [Caudoviricetes sp.]
MGFGLKKKKESGLLRAEAQNILLSLNRNYTIRCQAML